MHPPTIIPAAGGLQCCAIWTDKTLLLIMSASSAVLLSELAAMKSAVGSMPVTAAVNAKVCGG